MGTATGLFKNSTKNYSITLVGDDITTGTFDIVGDVVKQTGNQTRSVADIFIPIRSSQLRFTARNSETLFDELGLIKLGDVTITLNNLTDSVVEFIGYVQPQNIEKNQKWAAGDFVLTCFDGLILLQQNTYTLNSTYTLAGFLEAILEPLTVVNKALYVASWQEENMSSTSPALIRFDASVLNAANNYEALEIILKRFGLIITQSHSRDVIEWKIIQRNQIGGDTSGWLIDFSDSSVASQTQTDATTLADADLLSEHIKGKTDSIEDIETIFKWNVADPFILNSSFNQFNRSGLSSWEVKQGTVTQSFPDGNISSTDNAVISQRLNYIKGAGQPFRLDSKFNGTGVSFTINKGTFFYAKVSFIAPLGDSATLYLKDDGTVTTVETSLTYFTPAVQEGFNNLQEISVSLNVTDGNLAFNQDRIVVVDLLFSCLDDETAPRYSSFAWYSIKAVIEETDSFNELSTEINSTNFGGKLNNIFPLSDQTAYNAKGGIEVNDGSTWRLSSDWGTSEALDTVFTRDINRQSKNTLEYYKLKTIPSAFAKRGYSQGFTYSSVVFIPVYELINYTSSSIDLQIIEKTNLLPESLTTRFLSNNADINSSRVAIQDVYLVIKEVLGVVSVTNIQTDVLVEWSDIVVILQDGTRFTVADGQFAYEIDYTEQDPEPIVFYYDKPRNTILNKNAEAWFNSVEFLEGVNAVELFSVVGNTDADISGDTAAPFVSVFPKQIATGLFAAKNADNDAALNEIIGGFNANAIFKLGADIDAEVTSLSADTTMPLRVDLPAGTRLMLVSGREVYDIVVSALTRAGATSIPIQSQYIVAYKSAKVLFDNAFYQAQLLIQPSEVYVFAQSVNGTATSALSLSTSNEGAIASINTVFTENGITSQTNITSVVNTIGSRIALVTDTDGVVSSINLASGATGSSIRLTANQIVIAGVITAINDDTTTTIDGGKITTETITANEIAADAITADKIDVTNLSAVNANTGNLTVSGLLKSDNYVAGTDGFALNQDGSAEFQSVTVKGVLIAGSGSDIDWDYVNNVQIITAQIGDAQITSAKIGDAQITTAKIGDAQITTAKIGDAEITSAKIDSLDAAKINATSLSAVNANTGNLTVSGTLTIGTGSSITSDNFSVDEYGNITATGADITGEINATSGSLGDLAVSGALTLGSGGSIVSDNFSVDEDGNITAIGGTIGGLNISGTNISILTNPGSNFQIFTEISDDGFTSRSDVYVSGVLTSRNTAKLSQGKLKLETIDGDTSILSVESSDILVVSNTIKADGGYLSSDGSAGITETIGGFTDLIVKNGLITGYV